MVRINLLARLRADYPQFIFENANDFYWSPQKKTIFYQTITSRSHKQTLLHELAHALLGHSTYWRDIDLLRMEQEAWSYATETLGPRYDIIFDQYAVEETLDTYRDWLHQRSLCPYCTISGVQIDSNLYQCLGCFHSWRVNEARRCGLKRYINK